MAKLGQSGWVVRPLVLALAALPAVSPAIAGDEDLFFAELPVVASVSRLPQRLADAPTSVTVIDRDMIKASAARDLNDVFRLVPGFQTFPNNTDSARVTYHGLTDEEFSPRVQVLIDGRSQYSPLFRNGVNWATLPVALEDIERIEVVRGTNAVSYGSNAFLGVINIITVDPSLARGFSLALNHGNQGVRDYTLRNGGKIGESGDFRFTYQQRDDNGLADQFDWKDSYRSRLFDFRADFALTERDVLQFSAGHVEAVMPRGRLAKAGGVLTGGNDPGWPIHDFSQSNTYLQALWRRSLSAGSDFQLRYSYMADWASENYVSKDGDYLYQIDEYGDTGVRHEIEAQHNFALSDQARLVWGASWRGDALRSTTGFAGKSTVSRDVERLFGNLEWKPLAWFTGNAGWALERDSMAGTHASPRLSASYHINSQNTVRLGYSRAYRSPSSFDYRGNATVAPFARADGAPFAPGEQALATGRFFIGKPGLPVERLETWELGYLGDWHDWRMSLDVRLFQEKIPNRLMQMYRGPDFMAEVQAIRIEGIEYQWKWQPFNPTRLMVGQSFIHTYSEFLNSAMGGSVLPIIDPDKMTNLDLLAERSSPRHATSILLMQKLPYGFEFSAASYWLDKMRWTRNTEVAPYRRLDVRLGYPFRWGGMGGEVAYTVQSLNSPHGEYKANGKPADRVVDHRSWLTLRLDL